MTKQHFYIKNGKPQRQAGYTLVELSISVSIIAVLLAGSIVGVNRLLESNKVNNTVTQTATSLANISRVTTSVGNSALTTANLAPLGIWEKSSVVNTGTVAAPVWEIRNPFGGAIQVAANAAAVGTISANKGYWYRISNVPESSCSNLATALYSSAQGIYILAAQTAANAVGNTPPVTNGFRVPGAADSLANLTTLCSAGAGTNGVVEIGLFVPI
jgi:prepilin-type N-terminal cleavage/methylation domain-containing protein